MKDRIQRLWRRASPILDQVLDLPEAERSARVAELCRGDPELRQEVERLLAAGASGDGLLEDSAAAGPGALFAGEVEEAAAAGEPSEGERVGPYRVLRRIGHGGMGVVYLAERADGEFEQTVALKLVKLGLDTEAVLARFRRERQILARLEHRAIARLLDGGVSAEGRPYFAMEYVEGVAITAYCDRERLPIADRVRLFARVCDAVQYAHRNLVVHRDLKPSNILVTGEGDLKLLDFGIAKLLGDEGEQVTELTRLGLRALTPEYAAPEQVRGAPVTTATDVYALGVILFELLTGRRPYPVAGRGAREIERAVLESEPSRPSTIVVRKPAADGDLTAEKVAWRRSTSPAALGRALTGDLDAIVLQALRKEPERRYTSAESLREDLARHLASQPVTARPEGRLYRTAKFVRRHRLGVTAAAIAALSLAVGLGASVWQQRQTVREARRTAAVKEFLVSLFEGADPAQTGGAKLTVREVLDRGAERIEDELAATPALQGELMTVLGGIYAELGAADRADSLVEQALEIHRRLYAPDDPRVATNLRQQARLAIAHGDPRAAERLARQALAIHRRALGNVHEDVAEDLDFLAMALRQGGKIDGAFSRAQESLTVRTALYGRDDARVGDSIMNLAVLLRERGDYEQSADRYRQAVELRRRLLGDRHPDVSHTLHNFAALESYRGEYAHGERLAAEALENFTRLYGDDHPLTLAATNNRAVLLSRLGRWDEAEAGFRSVLDTWRRSEGEDHPNAMVTRAALAFLQRARGDLEGAETMLRALDADWRARMGDAHPFGARIRLALGGVLAERGRHEEAAALLRESLTRLRAARGEAHPEVADALHELGLLARHRGDLDAAAKRLRKALAIRRRVLGPRHPVTARSLAALGTVRRRQGDFRAARHLLEQALGFLEHALPAGHPTIVETTRELASIQESTGS